MILSSGKTRNDKRIKTKRKEDKDMNNNGYSDQGNGYGRTLCKSRSDKKLFGVCGGIAEYFGIDPTLVRIITVLLVAVGGMSLWVYIIAALLMK